MTHIRKPKNSNAIYSPFVLGSLGYDVVFLSVFGFGSLDSGIAVLIDGRRNDFISTLVESLYFVL